LQTNSSDERRDELSTLKDDDNEIYDQMQRTVHRKMVRQKNGKRQGQGSIKRMAALPGPEEQPL
jgi:hypothetical protein